MGLDCYGDGTVSIAFYTRKSYADTHTVNFKSGAFGYHSLNNELIVLYTCRRLYSLVTLNTPMNGGAEMSLGLRVQGIPE